jgi:hypothetical protein
MTSDFLSTNTRLWFGLDSREIDSVTVLVKYRLLFSLVPLYFKNVSTI